LALLLKVISRNVICPNDHSALLRPPPANDEEDDVHISVATTRDRHFCSRAVILKDGKIVDELFRSNAENDSAEAALEDLIFLMHKFGAEVNDDPPLHREELLSEYRYCWKLSVDINERADVINEAVARKTANDGVGASVEAGTTAPPTVQKSNENDNPAQAAGSSKTKKRNEARKRAKARKKEAGSQGDEASGNTVMLAE